MSLIKTKEGMSKTLRGLILAVIATMVILVGVIYPIVKIIENPGEIAEGIGCRAAIIMASKTEDITMGITKTGFKKSCSVIEKKLPLEKEYKGKLVSKMNADEFREALMKDFVELVARVWWITAEGERPEHLFKKITNFFDSENDCLVIYAARIHSPKNYYNFRRITDEEFKSVLSKYKKSEVFGVPFETDMSVAEYITFSGTGGVVRVNGTIGLKQEGSDAIYGVAVGFARKDGLSKLAENIFGKGTVEINPGASFILIAPYNQIAKLCDVNNE